MTFLIVIVEPLVIGLVSFVWIGLVLLRFCDADTACVVGEIGGHRAVAGLVLLAVALQVGWLTKIVADGVFLVLVGRRVKAPIYQAAGVKYEDARLLVYEKASADVQADIALDRTVVRLARCGALNWLLIAAAWLVYDPFLWPLSVAFLLMSGLFAVQAYLRFVRYHSRIVRAYGLITANAGG